MNIKKSIKYVLVAGAIYSAIALLISLISGCGVEHQQEIVVQSQEYTATGDILTVTLAPADAQGAWRVEVIDTETGDTRAAFTVVKGMTNSADTSVSEGRKYVVRVLTAYMVGSNRYRLDVEFTRSWSPPLTSSYGDYEARSVFISAFRDGTVWTSEFRAGAWSVAKPRHFAYGVDVGPQLMLGTSCYYVKLTTPVTYPAECRLEGARAFSGQSNPDSHINAAGGIPDACQTAGPGDYTAVLELYWYNGACDETGAEAAAVLTYRNLLHYTLTE